MHVLNHGKIMYDTSGGHETKRNYTIKNSIVTFSEVIVKITLP